MKIKTVNMDYEKVQKLPRPVHKKPYKPNRILANVARIASKGDLKQVNFTWREKNMERAGDGPWLILMNHSSFLDLEMVMEIMKGKPFQIVCTADGFIGKEEIMRHLGCIPTQKFVTDITLISDMKYALRTNKASVLMYPEASYSFDGTTTPLPRKLGVLLKTLKVPVVMISTFGSFARDPLYNNLQKRAVTASAEVECLLTSEEIAEKSVEELDAVLDKAFTFDYFKWQVEEGIEIKETFRADGLHRILYKCPDCLKEGAMEGKGIELHCHACGKKYVLNTLGRLESEHGEVKYPHIPDWYAWERETLRREIADKTYCLDVPVKIGCVVDFNAVYMVGEGILHHDENGFVLDGCDGKLHYEQGPAKSYSLYSDYYWYEIGDVICIGDKDCLYYCFPEGKDVAAKTRIAVEELFKNQRNNRRHRKESVVE